jgi:hypothetical protein
MLSQRPRQALGRVEPREGSRVGRHPAQRLAVGQEMRHLLGQSFARQLAIRIRLAAPSTRLRALTSYVGRGDRARESRRAACGNSAKVTRPSGTPQVGGIGQMDLAE